MRTLLLMVFCICPLAKLAAQPKLNVAFPKNLYVIDAHFPVVFKAALTDSGKNHTPLPKDYLLATSTPSVFEDTAWKRPGEAMTYTLYWSGLPLGADSLHIPVRFTDPASGQSHERTIMVYGPNIRDRRR